jgi:hypothetical protein
MEAVNNAFVSAAGEKARFLFGLDLRRAKTIIAENHYTRSVPSGETVTFEYQDAIVMFSIPANKNISGFLGFNLVWELTRLWAPDGHERNLLTKAISAACREFRQHHPNVEALVSYADPNVGHEGTVYKAASWVFHGQSEENRLYKSPNGAIVSRRAFHSGSKNMTRDQIIDAGYVEVKAPGKLRFVKPLTPAARRKWRKIVSVASR